MAAIAHFGAVVGIVAFFEFLWFLELWDASRAVLGIIAVMAVQRCIFKILIAVFLSREFKHDETNRAWWTVSTLTNTIPRLPLISGCLVQPRSRLARALATGSRVHCQDDRNGTLLGRFHHLPHPAALLDDSNTHPVL